MFWMFALITLGLLGILGMTWLFPTVARILWLLKRGRGARLVSLVGAPRISILIPAHNEAVSIARTLASVRMAIAQTSDPSRFRIVVGADGCTDRTAQIAKAAGAEVLEFPQQGKWRTLETLLEASPEAGWVIFADAGIEWPADFLAKMLRHFNAPDVMAVAPSYRVSDGGLIEQTLWSVERHFKAIETAAGGPVSIHGATVAYRRTELADVFRSLGKGNWLNDDVIIPLMMRARHPDCRIHYASDIFSIDRLRSSAPAARRELARRQRLVKGNIQWAKHAFDRRGIASVLALRRVFRLFWAYWALALALGVSLMLVHVLPMALAAALFLASFVVALAFYQHKRRPDEQSAVSKLMDAAIASWMAPIYLAQAATPAARVGFERTMWK